MLHFYLVASHTQRELYPVFEGRYAMSSDNEGLGLNHIPSDLTVQFILC